MSNDWMSNDWQVQEELEVKMDVKRLAGTGRAGGRAGSEDGCQTMGRLAGRAGSEDGCQTIGRKSRKDVNRLAGKEELKMDVNRLAGTGRAGSEDGCQTIGRLADIDDFLCLCDIEIKTMTSEKNPLQGPNGANSMQTKHDISQLITALKSLRDVVNETEPLFKAKFLLKSTSTTIVENLFSEMRAIKDTPLMVQFARRFSNFVRELFKRITQMCFLYYTSEYSQ
ncbi:unnamed protein product [Mytilus coruscus]|uniref:Uncharacterized protein n=1 Tax=Mytilus coruscus TaxID=42192 RepID=A0A6J8DXX3_MYTCO|nr:unnamed protein product [Mytilus coruscus]